MTRTWNTPLVLPIALVLALLPAMFAHGQDDAGSGASADSEEVDVDEESYRAFMELDDREIQRNNFPVAPGPLNVPRSLTGLPEASQRHLREQLRDIILSGGPWTPAAAGQDYPYVPSAAAEGDANLQRKEAGAWAELVDEYHAREAAIFEAGQRASAENAGDAGQTGAEGQDGAENAAARQAGSGQSAQSAQQSATTTSTESAARQAPSSESSRQVPRSTRPPDEGVSQSALEFLTGQPAPPPPPVESRPESAEGTSGSPRRSLTAEELARAAGLQRPEDGSRSPTPEPEPEPPAEDEIPQH